MADIIELATAYWRLNKWVGECGCTKKLPAFSSLRIIREFLDSEGVSVLDMTGTIYDSGFSVDIIHVEAPEILSEKPVIMEMLMPLIIKKGTVVQNGQAVLSNTYSPKKKKRSPRKTDKLSQTEKPAKASSKKKVQ
ncbi:MAG: hypothetical protein WC900_09425 [Oscillospiraceae bacterium]|jgi:hypothetical protein